MTRIGQDTLNSKSSLTANGKTYHYFDLNAVADKGWGDLSKLPFSLKVLLENLLRYEDGESVTVNDVEAVVRWLDNKRSDNEINYRPARVLMQDFTGVPGVVDLAAMRDAISKAGGDPTRINPLSPVDLVIDHSVMVDKFGNPQAFAENVDIEYQRNRERYQFLRWGQKAFNNFRVVPPGTGICHQVNLEYLAKGVWSEPAQDGNTYAYPDTLVGTDSHTTMINGLGVLGWGVGGIEAEAAMLGQPIAMLIPEVIGFKISGKLREGITATDLVLTVTEMLRRRGVVGKFVEFFGDGLADLTLADRATIANMAPEYGATCGFFPIDERTTEYMELSGRDPDTIALVEAYCKAQGLWRSSDDPDPEFTDVLELDLGDVVPSLAGPKRPQDRVPLTSVKRTFIDVVTETLKLNDDEISKLEGEGGQTAVGNHEPSGGDVPVTIDGQKHHLSHGDVVIAAITSCTNTSNPSVMLAAGLVAKKAAEKGLNRKPWVKTSLAPGSKVVTDYLDVTGLQKPLNDIGFDLVGYGCTTCIGNSGPLPDAIDKAIADGDLVVASVLSGNRNFEGRVHQSVRTNWLASPPLVVAYALAGTVKIDLDKDPIGKDNDGNPVYLKDIWPSSDEIQAELVKINNDMFRSQYASVFDGDETWQSLPIPDSQTYDWDSQSTYIQNPPFFDGLTAEIDDVTPVKDARILALLGDSITTDHISPAGAIKADSPAGHYLQGHDVEPIDFNSYGSRRGNHEVMMRGTFANIRIRNEMTPDIEGGFTKHLPQGEEISIYGAAMRYQKDGVPTVVVAGKEYGTGSSRDWAAKGTNLLGVKAVIAESFERIHRSNLIGMGVLPLQFPEGTDRKTLNLDGSEIVDIPELGNGLKAGETVKVVFRRDGKEQTVEALSRLDTAAEVEYYKHGGILHYVLRQMMKG
ncbi:MAG: aconitate hydratase AcnA [Alcanivoracaceae bacterium]|uniref:aconitate hydratase AcnA n=1 Tax=Alcanivorax sp. MD8A TaxID=1177157 RepID=UPI000C6BCFD1|nr:aconitate hydratase AcnA [Alcanivorax sp. MD8A]MAX55067.1 aconitate hydratase AcnA [Alcanivoracaceae bacterium]MCG8436649.1 aconitate hydratase AcnA [Pseudomonadales bacterium]MED5389279.1 aconitate hydratase AcnA [Pseudomonadota bacterium]MEE2870110.1 aconitate hydratase AcnA [Pseudomonadota bacterium]PNE04224.1 aconitate hydratase [Alcanivorax sp. MD8A]